jgi:hypothetical protein
MKTKNNIKKTNLKSTVFAGIILAGIIASTPVFSKTSGLISLNASLIEKEEAIELESWMTNESNFYSTTSLEAETEKTIELESWMTNESNFYSTAGVEAETEKALEIEDWMVSDPVFEKEGKEKGTTKNKSYGTVNGGKKFGNRTFLMREDKDPELKVESWMIDYRYWNRK